MKLLIALGILLVSAPVFAAGLLVDQSATNTDIAAVSGVVTIDGSIPGAPTQEIFIPVTLASNGAAMIQTGAYGPGCQTDADNERCHVYFFVPADFSSVTSVVMVVIPDATKSDAWWKISTEYGAIGQAPDAHAGGDASTTYNVVHDVLFEVDLSGTLGSMAAGDYVGVMMLQNTADELGTFLGVRLKY